MGRQAGTKEGEEALRFFCARDFETCLSALKSREIKEPRPSGRARSRRGEREGKEEAVTAEGTEKLEETHGIHEGWTDGPRERGARQKVARRSYTHRAIPPRSVVYSSVRPFVRSSYSCSPSFFFFLFPDLPVPPPFYLSPTMLLREECTIFYPGATEL